MTGIRPRRLAVHIISYITNPSQFPTTERARGEKIIHIAPLQASLDELHNDFSPRVKHWRTKVITAHNSAPNIVPPRFEIGDLIFRLMCNKHEAQTIVQVD